MAPTFKDTISEVQERLERNKSDPKWFNESITALGELHAAELKAAKSTSVPSSLGDVVSASDRVDFHAMSIYAALVTSANLEMEDNAISSMLARRANVALAAAETFSNVKKMRAEQKAQAEAAAAKQNAEAAAERAAAAKAEAEKAAALAEEERVLQEKAEAAAIAEAAGQPTT